MAPRTWKFAQRYNIWWQILYYRLFRINRKSWPFLGHPRAQKRSKIAHFSKSNPPEVTNLHRQINSYQIFDTITHLGQIKNSDLFWGHPEHQMLVQKGQKLPIALVKTHKSCKFTHVDNFSWEIWYCHTFNRILQSFDLF